MFCLMGDRNCVLGKGREGGVAYCPIQFRCVHMLQFTNGITTATILTPF